MINYQLPIWTIKINQNKAYLSECNIPQLIIYLTHFIFFKSENVFGLIWTYLTIFAIKYYQTHFCYEKKIQIYMNNTFPLILFVCEQIKKYVCFIVKLYEINKTKKKLFIYIHFRILWIFYGKELTHSVHKGEGLKNNIALSHSQDHKSFNCRGC